MTKTDLICSTNEFGESVYLVDKIISHGRTFYAADQLIALLKDLKQDASVAYVITMFENVNNRVGNA